MKRKLFIGGSIAMALVAVAVAGILIDQTSQTNERTAYEQYLNEQYQVFPTFSPEEIAEMPKMDRPDLAGLDDFYKTVDPELKTVPHWRAIEAYQELQKQKSPFKSLNGVEWMHHPTDMGGRTRALMFDPNDATNSKVWAGAVTGGLWYNEDAIAGGPWTPVGDLWPNMAISSITYDPNNTNTFYLGTGESQTALIIYRESTGRGSGLYKSDDAGASWELIPSTKDWAYVTDVIVRDEDGTSAIYAGVVSGIYQGTLHESGPSDGLYRSVDGGETWTQVMPMIPGGDQPFAPSDIEMSADKTRIFVGTTYHGVDRTGAAHILRSDNGIDWTIESSFYDEFMDGRTIANGSRTYNYPGRVMLAHSPSHPDILYALIAGGYVRSDQFIGYDCAFLLKTTNKGETWTDLPNIPMRGGSNTFAYLAWHALAITVSPYNPNLFWVGGLDTWRTVDGGETWDIMSNWAAMYGSGSSDYVHADIHSFVFRPGSDTDMIIGTDGGIFGTRSASGTNVVFFELNRNYSTLQYYSGAIHPDAGAIHFMGGLQDNGTMFYKKDHVPTHADMLSGGDGAFCFIDQDNPTIHLTTVYYNSTYLWRASKESDPSSVSSRGLGGGTFISPMDYNWRDDILFANGVSFTGDNPNRIQYAGISETTINNRLQKTLATDVTVPFSSVKWSENSPANESLLFLGTQAGDFFKVDNFTRNQSVTKLTGEDFPRGNISSIDDGQSIDTLLVTFSNYGVPSVWYSTDGGQTWANKESDLPDIPVRWGIIHPDNAKQVMLATDIGAWTTDDILADPVVWTQHDNGIAKVRIDMLKFRRSDNTVLAATHGRGMYTGIWDAVYASGVEDINLSSAIKVYPNPTHDIFQISFTPDSRTELIISDISGRIVFSETVEASGHEQVKSYDLSDQARGYYLITLANNKGKAVRKLLKN